MSEEVVCIGQALVDCITRGMEEKPYKKNVYRADSITLNTGGDALNESIVLAELGHPVRLVCGLGDDIAGQMVLHTAKEHGIDVSYAAISQELSTPIANLMVQKDGNRQSANSPSTMLTGYIPDERAFCGAKVVSFASLFRAPLDKKDEVLSLMKAAKDAGAIICADTKMPTYREMTGAELLEILPYIDYLFPNENEAAYYSSLLIKETINQTRGTSRKDTAQMSLQEMGQCFCEAGVKNVIIKAGENGCTIVTKEENFQIPAKKVHAVDTTGAGDNFVAGFIHGLLHGWNLRKCYEYGTACAALSVQYVGAVTGVAKGAPPLV